MAHMLLQCLQSSVSAEEKFKTINGIFKQLTASQVDEILAVLKTTPNNNVVRLKLADDFKRLSCVLDILENGDKSSISRASKLPWVYADGSDLINAEFLVTTFFPRISFSTRLMVINNLGRHLKNPQTADYIFSAVEFKYGFPVASAMLPACSEKVVIKCLESNRKYELSPTQLLILVKISPNIGLNYLRKLYTINKNVKHDYSSSLKYLLDHHTNETISVLVQYSDKWKMNLGARRSKTILRSSSAAIELVSKKPNFFKHSQLRKCLSLQQYEQAFLNTGSGFRNMLKNPWQSNELWQWLDHLPDFCKTALLRKSFRVAFDKEITDCPQYVTPDMLVLLPIEERLKIVDWKLDYDNCEYIQCQNFQRIPVVSANFEWFWIALKPIQDSIPELTKILDSERDCKKRVDLFSFLIQSCIFNKDSQALVKVLQLLTRNCRNDEPEIRQILIQGMNESTAHIEFEEKHWVCVQEVVQFVYLYKELIDDLNMVELLGKYASFHQKQGKSFDAELNLIIKLTPCYWHLFDISYIKEPERQREMMEGYIKALSAYAEKSGIITLARNNYIVSLIKEIVKWNRRHQRKLGPINVYNYPWLEKRCWETMSKKNDGYETVDVGERATVFKLLRQGNDFGPETLDKLLGNEVIYVPALYYSLKTNPEKIGENVENIMSYILKVSNIHEFHSFFIFVKKLTTYHWTLLDEIKDECKKILNHEDPKSVVIEIGNAVQLLAILEPPSDFLRFVSNYYPVEAKFDPSVLIDELDCRIKGSITGSLKYLQEPALLLPVVDRFLVGDYLKLALRPFYSICSTVPESQAVAYLQSQLKCSSVNVRKHIIRLFFMISPLDGKFKVLEEMWSYAKNPASRCEILKQMYHLFKSAPQERLWVLLKSSIQSMTDEDTPSLIFLKSSTIIDERLGKLLADFFQTILETFKRTGVYKEFEADIMTRIVGVIPKLEGNFLDSFIQETFSKIRFSTAYNCSQFAISYLMDESISPQIQIHRQNIVQRIIQDMLDHHWNVAKVDYDNEERPTFPTRYLLERICQDICNDLLDYRRKDKSVDTGKEVLQGLIKQLEKDADVTKTFRNVIYMKLTLITLEIMELEDYDWLKTFGQRVASLLSFYSEKYGAEITSVVSAILRDVCNQMCNRIDSENILRIIDGILQNGNDKYQLIAAISLLPQSGPNSAELLKINGRIISIIKSSKDSTVQLYLNMQENESDDVQVFNR